VNEPVSNELEDHCPRVLRPGVGAHFGEPIASGRAAVGEVADRRPTTCLEQEVERGLRLNRQGVAKEADTNRLSAGSRRRRKRQKQREDKGDSAPGEKRPPLTLTPAVITTDRSKTVTFSGTGHRESVRATDRSPIEGPEVTPPTMGLDSSSSDRLTMP
jgi:hypothetical protein